MVLGRRQVTAPAVAPLPYGLLAAGVVVDDNDVHLQGGVEYETLACGTAHLTAADCFTSEVAAGGVLTDDAGVMWTHGDGFMVYSLHRCLMPGGGIQDADRLVRAKLGLGEGRAIEAGFALSRLMTAATADDPYPDLTPVAGTALTPIDAVSVAEEWAAAADGGAYASVPTFHAARSLATQLTNKAGVGVSAENGRLQTGQGSIVASGAGYLDASRAAIGGVTPAAGARWLFLTGTVVVRRGPVDVTDPVRVAGAGGGTTNTFHVLAQRPVVVSSECFRARILVQSPRAAAGL